MLFEKSNNNIISYNLSVIFNRNSAVAKITRFFLHFHEHQKENNRLTIVHFLAIYNLHGNPKDKDYEEDMKLPFKTCSDCISSIVPAFVPVCIQLSTAKFIEIVEMKNYLLQDQFVLSSYLASI